MTSAQPQKTAPYMPIKLVENGYFIPIIIILRVSLYNYIHRRVAVSVLYALQHAENKLHGYMYMYIIIVLSQINENPGHLYNILFIGMFELFSEAV